jgi:MFS transporter, MHS family, shikimate and dehydroshikimate transport protein
MADTTTSLGTVGASLENASHTSVAAQKSWVAAATVIGTTIEWYDFFIYGTAAALIFNKLFFPSFDATAGTLAAFGTFAIGLFARPFGALIFGDFGDRVGRKSMLMLTLVLMGVPTVLIGLVPTYEQIGIWAAVMLVFLRVLQGIALGGEWGGAVLMAVEHAPDSKRSLFGSLPQAGVPLGLLLSTGAFTLSAACPNRLSCHGAGGCRSSQASCLSASERLSVARSPNRQPSRK